MLAFVQDVILLGTRWTSGPLGRGSLRMMALSTTLEAGSQQAWSNTGNLKCIRGPSDDITAPSGAPSGTGNECLELHVATGTGCLVNDDRVSLVNPPSALLHGGQQEQGLETDKLSVAS